MAKYYMIAALMEDGYYIWLVVLGLLMAAVSVYYYFKVIIAMYFKEGLAELAHSVSTLDKVLLGLCAALIFIIGILPDTLFQLMGS